MALRLSAALSSERRIDLGSGVSIWVRPLGLAEWETARHRARRLARERLPEAAAMATEAALSPGGPDAEAAAYLDRIEGLAAEILADVLIADHGLRWEGVEAEAGKPAPLNPETWRAFRSAYPMLAVNFVGLLALPASVLSAEGNG